MKNINQLTRKEQIYIVVLIIMLFAGMHLLFNYGIITYENITTRYGCKQEYRNGVLISEPCVTPDWVINKDRPFIFNNTEWKINVS